MVKKSDVYIGTDKAAIDALITRNLTLIEGVEEEAKKKIIQALTDGLIKGSGIDSLIDGLLDLGLDFSRSKAETIARTEVMYALNQGAINRYSQDGFTHVEWLAGPDDRCCDECLELDGKIFPINNIPDLPVHPNCRCTVTAVVVDEEDEE